MTDDENAKWLADLFEFELCAECGGDADVHTVSPDPFGLLHAWCNVSLRLEYLRSQIQGECISYGELVELQSLASSIDPGDVELLEWAGVPEFPGEVCPECGVENGITPTGRVEDGVPTFHTIDRCEDDPRLAYACSKCGAVWTVEANGATRLRYECQRCAGTGTIDTDGDPGGNLTCDRCAGAGFDYREDVAKGTFDR